MSPLSTHTVQGTQHMLRPHLELSCPRSHSQSADKLTLHTWVALVPSYTSQTLQSKAPRHWRLWLGQHPVWPCRHPLLHALCPVGNQQCWSRMHSARRSHHGPEPGTFLGVERATCETTHTSPQGPSRKSRLGISCDSPTKTPNTNPPGAGTC